MDFKLVKYYDTCCDRCGKWASHDIGAGALQGNKDRIIKILKSQGWKQIKGEVICGFCIDGDRRPYYNDAPNPHNGANQ